MCTSVVFFAIGQFFCNAIQKIKEFVGSTVSSKNDSHNATNYNNENDNDVFNDVYDENDNNNHNINTNNIQVKPIINIKIDDLMEHQIQQIPTTPNDIIKELLKLEEKKVDTIRRMYSIQSKIIECPKCKTKIQVEQNDNIKGSFLFPDSLIPASDFDAFRPKQILKQKKH